MQPIDADEVAPERPRENNPMGRTTAASKAFPAANRPGLISLIESVMNLTDAIALNQRNAAPGHSANPLSGVQPSSQA